MKKKVLTVAIFMSVLFFSNLANAQSLDFSQVLLVSSVEDTVPLGKVWKLTNMTSTASGVVNIGASPVGYEIRINGVANYIGHSAMAENDMAMSAHVSAPLWFPEGTRLRAGANVLRLSIIEFTVVP